jgi:AcrR family transcriptional regulator
MEAALKAGPRERLLRSAAELTYRRGVGVGVDAILEDAGVARRSLYQHFGGKDRLIAEMLRMTADQTVERYRAALEAGGDDPRERILSVFDGVAETTSRPQFRGCRYTAADLVLSDPDHPAHAETRAYKRRIHDLLEHELKQLRHPDPPGAAEQLLLLIDGALALSVTRPEAHPGRIARELAEQVLETAPTNR